MTKKNRIKKQSSRHEAFPGEPQVIFWGVRGSIATPGATTSLVGGNTSCVEINLGGEHIILDGGTGLRQLGAAQGALPFTGHLLLGHLHWDHIQGVPFFGPLFNPQSEVGFIGPQGLQGALATQMSGPTFPVGMELMGARKTFTELEPGADFSLGEVRVSTAALRHPGGGLAYRLEADGCSVVYAVDTEHPEQGIDSGLLALAADADLLIYDAQYLPEEYEQKVGWGHSTFEHGAALARAAGAERLILTHHDPLRDDLAVERLLRRARQCFAQVDVAREGRVVHLKQPSHRAGEPRVSSLAQAHLGA